MPSHCDFSSGLRQTLVYETGEAIHDPRRHGRGSSRPSTSSRLTVFSQNSWLLIGEAFGATREPNHVDGRDKPHMR